MLQGLDEEYNSQEIIESIEAIVESDRDSDNEGMFENFRGFVPKNIQQGIELGNLACIQDLLLPNWCRIHNAFHSELSCTMCKIALEQVYKKIPEVVTLEEIEILKYQRLTLHPKRTLHPTHQRRATMKIKLYQKKKRKMKIKRGR